MTEGLEARQENLRRVNLALTVLSAADRAMLHATDEQSLLTDICRIIVTIGGYNSAWIAFAQHDAQQPVKLAARWDADQRPGGFAAGDRAGDQPALGFARIAIGNERLCVIKNYQSQESECASFLALRLQVGDQAIGALVVAAAQRDAFGEREVALLSDTADDLAHRIASLRTALQPEWTAQSA
jgi:transcriptional regulator with GAF, ATPase, and Fis domain